MDSLTKTAQVCPECGTDFTPYNNRKNVVFCGYECQVKYNVRRRRQIRTANAESRSAFCPWCKTSFIPATSRHVFCSDSCREQAKHRGRRAVELATRTPITCGVCGAEFLPLGGSRNKYCSPRCRQKAAALQAVERRKSDPARYSEYQKGYRDRNNRSVRKHRLKNWYGLTIEEYEAMLEAQAGCCAICGEVMVRPAVDHRHDAAGKVRALLCGPCNSMLGMAKEDPAILRAAASYVEKWDAIIAANAGAASTGRPSARAEGATTPSSPVGTRSSHAASGSTAHVE